MVASSTMDKTYHIIMERIIAAGRAPDYAEIGAALGVSPADGRKALRELFSSFGFPGWLRPGTDNIESFAPFHNVPNDYRLTVEGEQKWFAQ